MYRKHAIENRNGEKSTKSRLNVNLFFSCKMKKIHNTYKINVVLVFHLMWF